MNVKALFAALLISLVLGCKQEMKVTLAGPSIPDQLNSRGYVAPPEGVEPPDTSGTVPDTLR